MTMIVLVQRVLHPLGKGVDMSCLQLFTKIIEDWGIKSRTNGSFSLSSIDDKALVDLYFMACEELGKPPILDKSNTIIGGQLEICCHIIDYDFDTNQFSINEQLAEEIEEEIKKIIELEICKERRSGELELDIKIDNQIIKLYGGWEIRK